MAINFLGKIQANPYINTLNYNTNPQFGIKKNFTAPQYNTNRPRVTSDFAQNNFTNGYYVKAENLDLLA